MRSYNRFSGIGIIGNIPWGTHFCQFYHTKEDLIDILIPYFKAGLENNEFCMWVTSEPLGVEEAKKALRRSVPDFEIYLKKGQIEIIPYTHWYVKEGVFDPDRVLNGWVEKLNQALANGFDGLRLTGNTFWLEKKDWNAFVDYEEKIDRVLGNCNMISLCTYSLDRCNATEIIDVVANHQFALIKRDGKWEQIESSRRKQADITHRDALSEAECFRQALEYVPSYIYMKDLQSRYIYANKQTLELFGCSAKELIGCDDTCFFPPETVKRLREVDLRVFSGEHTYEEIDVAYIGSGRRVYLEIKTPIYLESECKTICGLLGISTDITERKHAEEALELTQASVDLASDNILWITAGGKVIYANNAACKSLQYSRDELQRMYIWNINPLYTKEIWLEHWLEIKKRGSFTFETLHRAKDGREFPVEVSVNYVQSGDMEFDFAYIKDITERKRTEEALRESEASLAKAQVIAHLANWEMDVRKDSVRGSEELYRMLNLKPDFTLDAFIEKIHPEDRSKVVDSINAAIYGGKPYNIDYRTVLRPNNIRYMHAEGQVTYDKDGQPLTFFGTIQDVTERKRAGDVIETAAINLARAERLASLGHWDWDLTTNQVKWSEGHFRIFGYTVAHGTDTYEMFWDRVHPEDIDDIEKVLREGMEKDTGYKWDYRLLMPDGSIRYIHAEADRPVKNTYGNPVRWFGTVQDVTERRKVEEALKKARDNLEVKVKERTSELEEAYNSLLENELRLSEAQRIAHIGNWDWNLLTDKLYWSDEIYHIFGLDPLEFVPTYNEFLSHVGPEDRSYVHNATLKALNGEPYDIEYKITLPNGEKRMAHSQGEVVYDQKCTPVRMRGVIQDITERKKTEEKIQTLANAVESSNDAIITESLEGIITSWNKGAEQVYGYSAEEILGKGIRILEPANLKGEVEQLIEKIKRGETIRHYDTLRLKKDGTLINVSMTLSPVFNASGELVAVSAIVRDITESIKAAKALERMDKIRIKEIHHRIKNNLQVISSLLDLQAEKFEEEKVKEAFREGQNRVISMSLLHEELYKGEGTDTLDFSSYLQKLAENLFSTYNLFSKNVRLSMDLEDNSFLDMDTAVPLGIIVNELISNSLKHAFTEDQQGEIRIRLCRDEEMSDKIQKSIFNLTISDNGKGIPDNLELENAESLGLQLVGILVDQLDGEFELRRNNGTEFTIRFTVIEKDNQAMTKG